MWICLYFGEEMMNFTSQNLPRLVPEMPGEENEYRIDLQPSDVHEKAKIQFQKRRVCREVTGGSCHAEGGACIRQHGEGRSEGRLKVESLKADDHAGEQEDRQVRHNESADTGNDLRRQDRVVHLYGNDAARVDSFVGASCDQLEHHDEPDYFDGAGSGRAAAADQHQGEEDHLAGDRPDHVRGPDVSSCGGHADDLEEGVPHGVREIRIVEHAKSDGADENADGHQEQEDAKLRIFERPFDFSGDQIVVEHEVHGCQYAENRDDDLDVDAVVEGHAL